MRSAMRSLILLVFAACLSPLHVHAAHAEPERVSLALILAIDTSASVDVRRYELQRRGYAAALRAPSVAEAIQSLGRPAVITIVQWAAPVEQEQAIGWKLIESRADLHALADEVEQMPRMYAGNYTAIGEALDFCAALFDTMSFSAVRRIIDISGDGTDDGQVVAGNARDRAVKRGITINGLPILREEPMEVEVVHHYQHHVIGGYKAFFVVAKSDEDFPRAILRKLETEIAAR